MFLLYNRDAEHDPALQTQIRCLFHCKHFEQAEIPNAWERTVMLCPVPDMWSQVFPIFNIYNSCMCYFLENQQVLLASTWNLIGDKTFNRPISSSVYSIESNLLWIKIKPRISISALNTLIMSSVRPYTWRTALSCQRARKLKDLLSATQKVFITFAGTACTGNSQAPWNVTSPFCIFWACQEVWQFAKLTTGLYDP